MTLLSVNVDHVATLRQARGSRYPDPVEAAKLAIAAGAGGITVHLRADRRHIQESDIAALDFETSTKLNLEMAMTDEMLGIATKLKPDQITLVPEQPDEITTEGGLDLLSQGDRAIAVAEQLAEAGIAVSVFLDPDDKQVGWLVDLQPNAIKGIEINTDRYSLASDGSASYELAKIREIAHQGSESGLRIYAGHGLTTANAGSVAAIDQIEELNIGHFLICRAVMVGMRQAVEEMLQSINQADSSA